MAGIGVGAHVKVGAKKGVVRFIGTTSFAVGEWYGVELAQPKGKNDGTVNGETYFQCPDNHGLFCKRAQLRKDRSYKPPPEEPPSTEAPTGAVAEDLASTSAAHGSSKRTKPDGKVARPADPATYVPRVGDRARFREQEGRISFVGETQFSSGSWCGLVLDTPGGKNNGTVQGVQYFECEDKHGLFVRPQHLVLVATVTAKPAATAPPPQINTPNATSLPASVSTPSATSTPRTPTRSAGTSPGRAQTQSRLLREQRKALKAHENTISDLRKEVERKDAEIIRLRSSSSASPSSSGPAKRQEEADDDRVRSLESKHNALATSLRGAAAAAEERATEAESKCNALQARLSRIETQQDKSQASARKKAVATSKAERRCKELEEEVAELNEMVETLTLEKEEFQLEKELAEEKAVDLQLELEQKTAALEDARAASVATASSGSSPTVDTVDGNKTTNSGDVHNTHDNLVSQNNKLREALLRLRDSSARERANSERRILALEKDTATSREASEKVRSLEADNARLEEAVEHLKDQVDDANGFETLVEDLTERNMELTDEAADLAASVAELEELRDLSEEVEAQHVEFAQQLHEEVREKEAALTALAKRLREAGERDSVQQRDIDRFRELSRAQEAELEETRQKLAQLEQMSETMEGARSLAIDRRLLQRTSATAARQSTLRCQTAVLDAKLERFTSGCLRSMLPRESIREEEQSMQSLRLIRAAFGKVRVLREQSSYVVSVVERAEEDAGPRSARAAHKRASASSSSNKDNDVDGNVSSMSPSALLSRAELDSCSRSEVQGLCKKYGLRAVGKTVELVDRLVAFADEQQNDQNTASGEEEENKRNVAPGSNNAFPLNGAKESSILGEDFVPHPYRVLCARSGVLLSDAEYYSRVLEVILCSPWGISDAQFAQATKRAIPAQRQVDSALDQIIGTMRASSDAVVRTPLVKSLEASVSAMAMTTDRTLRLVMSENVTDGSAVGEVRDQSGSGQSSGSSEDQKQGMMRLQRAVALEDVSHGVARLSALCALMSAVLGQHHHAVLLAAEDGASIFNDSGVISDPPEENDRKADADVQSSVIEALTELSKSHASLRREVKRLNERLVSQANERIKQKQRDAASTPGGGESTDLGGDPSARFEISDLRSLAEHITACRTRLARSVAMLQAVVPGEVNRMAAALFRGGSFNKENAAEEDGGPGSGTKSAGEIAGARVSCLQSHKGARERFGIVMANTVLSQICDSSKTLAAAASPSLASSASSSALVVSSENLLCPAFDRQVRALRERVASAVQLQEEQRALKSTLSKRIQEVYMKQRELDTVSVRVEKLKRKVEDGAKALVEAQKETQSVRESMSKEQAHFEEALEEVHQDVDRLEAENHRFKKQLKKRGGAIGAESGSPGPRERATSNEISRSWRMAAKAVILKKKAKVTEGGAAAQKPGDVLDNAERTSVLTSSSSSSRSPGLKAALQAVVAQNHELRAQLIVGRIRKLRALPAGAPFQSSCIATADTSVNIDATECAEEARTCAVQLQRLKSSMRLQRARRVIVDLSLPPARLRGASSQLQLERAQQGAEFEMLARRIGDLRTANRIALGMLPMPFGRRNFRVLPLASLRPVLGRVPRVPVH